MTNKELDYDSLPIIDTPEIKNQTFKISNERYQALKKSIEFDGLKEPIKMVKLANEKGEYLTIVDGHTRRDILKDLKIPLGYSETLPMRTKYENFIVLNDVWGLEDSIKEAHILNDFRRQADKYQIVANALKVREIKFCTDKEIASKIGVAQSTVTQVRNIQEKYGDFQKLSGITDLQIQTMHDLMSKLEAGEKSIKDVYALFNVAGEVTELISKIEDSKFQSEMSGKYETEKYTNKNALKQLQEDITLHDLKKEGKYEPTKYDKKIYPLMSNLIKFSEEGCTDIKTVIYSGSKPSVDNALDSIQRYLKENMDENVVDILEAVRVIILKEYETIEEDHGPVPKDLSAIMKKITKIFKESKVDYFATVMRKPNNPKVRYQGNRE